MTHVKTGSAKWLYPMLLALISAIPTHAQDNEYKIDNSLYEIFVRANKVRYEPEALALADTMYSYAVKAGDKKAQCIAMTIPVSYYANSDDESALQKAVTKCQNEARANKYLQYYYFASSAQITYFLKYGKLLRAMQLSKTMLNKALKDRNGYGILQSYRMQGHIYTTRHCHDLAIDRYSKALDYMLSHQDDQDPSSLYAQLADCYIRKGRPFYNTALENIEKGIQTSKTYSSRMHVLMLKGRLQYLLGHLTEFNSIYNKCVDEINSNGLVHKSLMQELDIYHMASQNLTDAAFAMTDSAFTDYDCNRIKEYIAINSGDYKKAYEYNLAKSQYRDSITQSIHSGDIDEINTEMNLMRIKQQNKQLMNSRRYAVIISIVLLIAFGVLYILFRNKKKFNKTLLEQNEELEKARDQAESANHMKDAFIHNMSHEIRTPLNAIVGISQIITMPDMQIEPEEKVEYNNIICHNAELLTTIINDILDLAALENGKYSVTKNPMHCNELCRLTLVTVKHRCQPNVNLHFTTTLPDDFQIVSDEKRIRQVLINFLSNALKHTEQGEVHLHASLTDDARNIYFSVTDTGTGIPADKIPALFDRFVRLNTDKPGTGLGLNICKVIADLLGGEVYLDPTYTGGARFVFTLPLDNDETDI